MGLHAALSIVFLQAAEAEYRELLRQFPQYGDCCLRLACIAKARGDTKVRPLRPPAAHAAAAHAALPCGWSAGGDAAPGACWGRSGERCALAAAPLHCSSDPPAVAPSLGPGPQEALRWAEQATEIPAYAADALALQAGLHLEKRDYHHAKQASTRNAACNMQTCAGFSYSCRAGTGAVACVAAAACSCLLACLRFAGPCCSAALGTIPCLPMLPAHLSMCELRARMGPSPPT